MRIWSIALLLAGLSIPGAATTLQKLDLGEMARQSTMIVRAKVVGSTAEVRGQDIYTFYRLEVIEGWKAAGRNEVRVAVPGGVANGLRQSVAGAPSLATGSEYVMFLWTSRSGLTQLIGLSQGLFDVRRDAKGEAVVTRPVADEVMLDKNGHVTGNQAIVMPLAELRTKVARLLSGEKSGPDGK